MSARRVVCAYVGAMPEFTTPDATTRLRSCARCGIDTHNVGVCLDCAEVTNSQRPAARVKEQQVLHSRGGRTVTVTSTHTRGSRLTDAEHDYIVARTREGMSIRAIALAVGCSSRQVVRIRVAARAEVNA